MPQRHDRRPGLTDGQLFLCRVPGGGCDAQASPKGAWRTRAAACVREDAESGPSPTGCHQPAHRARLGPGARVPLAHRTGVLRFGTRSGHGAGVARRGSEALVAHRLNLLLAARAGTWALAPGTQTGRLAQGLSFGASDSALYRVHARTPKAQMAT